MNKHDAGGIGGAAPVKASHRDARLDSVSATKKNALPVGSAFERSDYCGVTRMILP